MRKTLAITAALLSLTTVAYAQTKQPGTPDANSSTNAEPGTGGRSGAGQPGLPGNKSGPAAREPGASGDASSSTSGSMRPNSATGTGGSDNATVPGTPGNKSGPSAGEPSPGSSR